VENRRARINGGSKVVVYDITPKVRCFVAAAMAEMG
jgi:hypothetical protein